MSTPAGPPLLDADATAPYLRGRGVLPASSTARVEELAGGVSSTVLWVRHDGGDLVVKQALPVLRVRDHWPADPARASAEAAALRLAARYTPASVPRVLDEDALRHVLVLQAAPADWRPWKADLLAGRVDVDVARTVGVLVGTWHEHTFGSDDVPSVLRDGVRLEQLRLEPYLHRTAERLPALADPLLAVAARLRSRSECLVHGDLSPKNVLVGAGGPWILDFEVAHLGDPAFDVAFLTAHLLLKAVHRPDAAERLAAAADAFHAGYASTGSRTAAVEAAGDAWMRVAGALVLARVHGASPVEYLDAPGRAAASQLGTRLLLDPPEGTQNVRAAVEAAGRAAAERAPR